MLYVKTFKGGLSLGSATRKRNKMIPIRLSDEEFEILKEKADNVDVSIPAYLRSIALDFKAPGISKQKLESIRTCLDEVSTEIDYISYCVTVRNSLNVKELNSVNESLVSVYKALASLKDFKHQKSM